MHVDDPGKLRPFLIPVKRFSPENGETRMPVYAYEAAKNAAISFKISASLFDVSSNPGVSISIVLLPSTVNSSESWTSAVDDSKLIPIRRLEPLARLINWKQLVEFLVIITGHTRLTDDFPLPVAPMTL